MEAVQAFVIAIGLEQCADRFRAAEVDGMTIMTLKKEESQDLGMNGDEFEMMQDSLASVITARTESKQEYMQLVIGNKHAQAGAAVAANPVASIIISLVVTVALSCGILMLRGLSGKVANIPMDNDFMYNFAPKPHESYVSYKDFEKSFERFPRNDLVLLKPRSGDNILTAPALAEIFKFIEEIKNLEVEFDGKKETYGSLCKPVNGKCSVDSVLNLFDNKLSSVEASDPAKSLHAYEKKTLETYLGSVEKGAGSVSAKGAILGFTIKDTSDGNHLAESASRKWELALKNFVLDAKLDTVKAYVKTERSLADESVSVRFFFLQIFLIVFHTILSVHVCAGLGREDPHVDWCIHPDDWLLHGNDGP